MSNPPTSEHAAANKNYFDQYASTHDDSSQARELARRSARAMRKIYPFEEDITTVMDFACGRGLISRELAPYAKSIIGVDISQGMVDQFNERVLNQGIPLEEMHAVCADLKGTEGELDGVKFDVVVCASSYHHFTSIDEITSTLAFFLKPGGALLVVDLLKTDYLDLEVLFPDHSNHIVAHRGGFKEEIIRDAFKKASLGCFTFEDAMKVRKKGHDVKLFIAKGIKR